MKVVRCAGDWRYCIDDCVRCIYHRSKYTQKVQTEVVGNICLTALRICGYADDFGNCTLLYPECGAKSNR